MDHDGHGENEDTGPGKGAEAFRTISELAAWLDVPPHVLRFWESRFPQLQPVKRAGGRRYYRREDALLIGGLKTLLHDRGDSIRSVQDLLADGGVEAIAAHSPELGDPPARTTGGAARFSLSGENEAEGAETAPADDGPPPAFRRGTPPEQSEFDLSAGADTPQEQAEAEAAPSGFSSRRRPVRKRTIERVTDAPSRPIHGFFFNDLGEDATPPPIQTHPEETLGPDSVFAPDTEPQVGAFGSVGTGDEPDVPAAAPAEGLTRRFLAPLPQDPEMPDLDAPRPPGLVAELRGITATGLCGSAGAAELRAIGARLRSLQDRLAGPD